MKRETKSVVGRNEIVWHSRERENKTNLPARRTGRLDKFSQIENYKNDLCDSLQKRVYRKEFILQAFELQSSGMFLWINSSNIRIASASISIPPSIHTKILSKKLP